MIPQIPDGYAFRIDSDTGAPKLIKVERGQERPGISMEQALQQAEHDAARQTDDYQEAGQWLRTRSPRQALLEIVIRLNAIERRLNDELR